MKSKKAISIILFILAIVVSPLSFTTCCLIGEVDVFGLSGFSFMWISFFFLPIPLFCLVFGIICKKGGLPMKKNIVIGTLSLSIIFLMGLSSFGIDVDRSTKIVTDVSDETGLYFPLNYRIMTTTYKNEKESNLKITDSLQEMVFFKTVKEEPWVSVLPPASKGVLSNSIINKTNGFDYYCLYVRTTGTFNPSFVPTGDYSLVLIAYKNSKHHIKIIETNVSV